MALLSVNLKDLFMGYFNLEPSFILASCQRYRNKICVPRYLTLEIRKEQDNLLDRQYTT